jgi:Domain of unknown function (DUF6265)
MLRRMAPLLLSLALLTQPTPNIESVSWLAGHWAGTGTDDVSEEVWLPPTAGAMVGMWRWAGNGSVRLYELLTIAPEGNQLVLRLRHFRPNLNGLEEKDAPLVLPAVRVGEREVVFEGPGSEGQTRIVYRQTSADTLESMVSRGTREPQVFQFKRK